MPASRLAPLSPAGSRRFSASYITPYNAQESKIWRQVRPLRREASNCAMTAEPDISYFEILSAIPVNAAAAFKGENGPYCRNAAAHASQYRQLTCPDRLDDALSKRSFLTLSADWCAFGLQCAPTRMRGRSVRFTPYPWMERRSVFTQPAD